MNFLGLSLPSILVLCLSCALIMPEPFVDADEDCESSKVSFRGERSLETLITGKMIEDVFKSSEEAVKARLELENKLYKEGLVVNKRMTDSSLVRSRTTDPIVRQYELLHMTFDEATSKLHDRFNLTRNEIARVLRTLPLTGELSRQQRAACTQGTAASIKCDPQSKYRTADGSCNNLRNPTWGRAMTCQKRLMDAYYVGNDGFRQSKVDGGPLPEPRLLSMNLHNDLNRPTDGITHLYMFFGQLLDHDIAFTPSSTTVNNEAIQCCPVADETHAQCAPILPRPDDPFYGPNNVTCLNFVRSAMCATCNLGHKQVMNQPTSYIDCSFVYGNSDNETNSLRTNDGTGRLQVQRIGKEDLLPPTLDRNNDQCSMPQEPQCFRAGDSRVNQHPHLTCLQTLFLRVHNSLADGLRRQNPHWGGDRIFQEARRILIAIFQLIVYDEFLPITLGQERMNYYKLRVLKSGCTTYNERVDASLIVEFSTAAYRLHTLINYVISNPPLNETGQPRLLRDNFFNPIPLYQGQCGTLLWGASKSPAQQFDRHLVPDVTNFLYRVRGDPTGLDLAAFNINRGRDHGLPPYVVAVRYCSGGKFDVKDFNDLVRYKLMGEDQKKVLEIYYRHVGDVDMWPGMNLETPLKGTVVGPTGACVIGIQFKYLKFGDRFYFEHCRNFTSLQLKEIRKMSLSKLICLHTDVPEIAKNAMLFTSDKNPIIDCRQVQGIDLSKWREDIKPSSVLTKVLSMLG